MYSESYKELERRDRLGRVLNAAFVVACYLVIFAGLLYSVVSQTGAP